MIDENEGLVATLLFFFKRCLSNFFLRVSFTLFKSTSSSKKGKKLKKRRKKTPRVILKKFSRDSLKIEKEYKKELLKIKRSRIKGLRDAKKGYTPEVKAEIERDRLNFVV